MKNNLNLYIKGIKRERLGRAVHNMCMCDVQRSDTLLKTLFNFSHDYFKLKNYAFTTIRSINYMKNSLRIGSKGWITLQNRKLFLAIIMGYKDARICDINLDVLKQDAEYSGFLIASHQDFVDLLNSFTRFKQNRLTTVKRVFFVQRIGGRQS